jgi:hypothetical protein
VVTSFIQVVWLFRNVFVPTYKRLIEEFKSLGVYIELILVSIHRIVPVGQSGKLLQVLTSTVILGFGSYWDP